MLCKWHWSEEVQRKGEVVSWPGTEYGTLSAVPLGLRIRPWVRAASAPPLPLTKAALTARSPGAAAV